MIQCDASKRILIVGEVYLDRHHDLSQIRLGGLFHAARTLNALGVDYAAAYIAPQYLDDACETYLSQLNARIRRKLGNVIGAPNIMEIRDSGEAGQQGYVDLLRTSRCVFMNSNVVSELVSEYGPTDLFIVAGGFSPDFIAGISAPNLRVHIDLDHDEEGRWQLSIPFASIFYSTSGAPFKRVGYVPGELAKTCPPKAATAILKENRGGSRILFSDLSDESVDAPSYPTDTRHSVGVGDSFDAVWIAAAEGQSLGRRLRSSAYAASLYASTFDHQEYIRSVQTAAEVGEELENLCGVRIPWEKRPQISVYIAAPDFPTMDTQRIDELEAAIRYHNFSARRPIIENGLGHGRMTPAERRALYTRDVDLLHECDLMVAVPLSDDTGTFAELGWFASSRKPTILFDPERRVTNLFASNTATRVCRSYSGVIDAIFELLGREEGHGW